MRILTGPWTSVFVIGVVQGLFLLLALVAKPAAHPAARRTLAGLVGACTIMIAGIGLGELLPPEAADLVGLVNISTELALGPLALLFVRSVVRPERRLERRDGYHLIPVAVGWFGGVVAWVAIDRASGTSVLPRLQPHFTVFVVLKALHLAAYGVAAYRELTSALHGPRRFSAGRQDVDLDWLRTWFRVLGVMAGVIYATELGGRLGLELPVESDALGSLLLTSMIYLGTLMVLVRPWVLSLRATVPDVALAADVERLTEVLERRRPWLDPELKLLDLARATGLSENRLSAVINDGLDTTFYALVHRYRLAEFRRLVERDEHRGWSVLDLAYESGFNSKAVFYRVFKEEHGVTPAAYRKSRLRRSA